MLDGFNGSMHVNFIEEVLLILMNARDQCMSIMKIAIHIDVCYKELGNSELK